MKSITFSPKFSAKLESLMYLWGHKNLTETTSYIFDDLIINGGALEIPKVKPSENKERLRSYLKERHLEHFQVISEEFGIEIGDVVRYTLFYILQEDKYIPPINTSKKVVQTDKNSINNNKTQNINAELSFNKLLAS